MEAAAAFLLLLIVVIVAVVGGVVWLFASSLRRRKLDAEGDKIDRHMMGTDGSFERAERTHAPEEDFEERPEHHRVTSEQGSRSIPRH